MEEKLSILTELIKMARVDAEVRQIEYDFMLAIAKMLDVDEPEFQRLFNQYSAFTPQPSEFDRIFQFHRLVLVANVDLNLNSLEIAKLKECGLRLGLRPAAVENVLREMNNYENGMIPPEVMLRIFQVYHN